MEELTGLAFLRGSLRVQPFMKALILHHSSWWPTHNFADAEMGREMSQHVGWVRLSTLRTSCALGLLLHKGKRGFK